MACPRILPVLVMVLLSLPGVARSEELQRLRLAPGETRVAEFPEGVDLKVSRRGVIDLSHLSGRSWQVTGIRGGIVVVGTRGEGDAGSRLIVEVESPKHGIIRETDAYNLPGWLCKSAGIRCDNAAGIVEGLAPSYPWFLAARTACRAVSPCVFAVTLSERDVAKWRAEISGRLGAAFRLRDEGVNMILVEADCDRDELEERRRLANALTNGGVDEGWLFVRCADGATTYRLDAWVFLVEVSSARRLGFEGSASATASSVPPLNQAKLVAELKAMESSRQATVLGQPTFRLVPFRTAEVTTGGEYQVIEHAVEESRDARRSSWKQHGLKLAVTARPLSREAARLQVSLSLKSRQKGLTDALSSNSLSSSVDVTIGEPIAVGLLDLATGDDESRRTPGLANIPLIGPLFRIASTEDQRSRLILWMLLTREG